MVTPNFNDLIIDLLQKSDLLWILANLRQDFVVWNALMEPEFYAKLNQLKPSGSNSTAEDFSPSRFALLALEQTEAVNNKSSQVFEYVDDQIVQTAIRCLQDQTLLQVELPNLSIAGLIALALAHNYRTTDSWNGLLFAIDESPGNQWLSPLACLYGFVDDPINLLKSLIQPGASPLRIELAVHSVLSNPIPPGKQLNIFMGLCRGAFGDFLPARERKLLVQSLYEQRPQSAEDFCLSWMETDPISSKSYSINPNDPVEIINQLAETLFQAEIYKISGKTRNIPGLMNNEKDIIQQLYTSLISHYASNVSMDQDEKLIPAGVLTLEDALSQLNSQFFPQQPTTRSRAEFTSILANRGFTDDAIRLIPESAGTLPDNLHMLYTLAKLCEKAGNPQRARDAAIRITEILEQKTSDIEITVWGEHFSLVNFGKLLLDLHLPDQASRIIDRACHICPNDASLLILLSDCYRISRKNNEASEILKTLVSLYPRNLEYHRKYAQSLEALNDWDASLPLRAYIYEADQNKSNTSPTDDIYAYAKCALNANNPGLTIKICDDLLALRPEDCQALIYSGEAYLQCGKSILGMDLLVKATQVSPHELEAWLALAEAQRKIYPVEAVIETLNNASQAVPDSFQIHNLLGELYLLNNAPTLALPEFKSAQALSPANPQVLFSYGRVLKLLGHKDESRAAFSKAFELDPALPELAQAYSKILVEMGELEGAIQPLELLIDLKTSPDPTPYLDYARCVLSLNKQGAIKVPPMKSLIALNEVLQIDPGNTEAKALIAETLAAIGDNNMAFQAYREALDTSLIEDKNWLERLSYGFGCVASAIGKHDIAIAALQEAGQVNPENPVIFKALSNTYLAANLLEDSIRAARNVLVIAGEDADNLAWFAKQAENLIRHNNPDLINSVNSSVKTVPSEALNALAKAIHLAPTRTDFLVQLGHFQSAINAPAEAQATFASIALCDFASIDDLKKASEYLSGIGDHENAIACLENGITQDLMAVDGHDPVLYARLAQEYVSNNDPASAINTLDKAIARIPGDESLISLKIEILLGLGQSIDALNYIEDIIQTNSGGKLIIDLLFRASIINRSTGDFPAAIRYAQKAIDTIKHESGSDRLSGLHLQYKTQLAEIYRALVQTNIAYNILDDKAIISASDFSNEQDYLDYLCLHTELALETGGQVGQGFQDIHLEPSHPSFSRLMAITARLLNKAGNYKQAEQLFQIAVNTFYSRDLTSGVPNWYTPHYKYLTLHSITEAGLDLGLWEQAGTAVQNIMQSSPGEPLSNLLSARVRVLIAEFYNLCEVTEVRKHKPSVETVSEEAKNQVTNYFETVRSTLRSYRENNLRTSYELNEDSIDRWEARALIAFKQELGNPTHIEEILAGTHNPYDTAAIIYQLHQNNLRSPDRVSISRIVKIARSFSNNPTVLFNVAQAIQDENPADAMKSLQAVLEQNPNSKTPIIAFCNILLTKVAMNIDQYSIAKVAIGSAIEIWDDEPGWHMLAAQVYKQLSTTNVAIHHIQEAIKLSPKDITCHMELGKVYFENAYDNSNMLKQALNSFERVLGLEPHDVTTLIYTAKIQYLLNDIENAETNARNAMLLEPNRADIYQLLSEVAIRNNDYQGAYEYANKAIQFGPKNIQSTIILARSLSALGRHGEALTKLNSLLSTVPDSRMLHLERVNIIRKINGTRAGLNELQSLLNNYPEDFQILNALAKSYIEVGEAGKAIIIAQQALNVCTDKTPTNERANLHLLIGQVQRQSGQLDQAIQYLNEAIQLAPDRLEPYLELGLAQKERREYQAALQIFEQATSIDPDDPRAPYQAGLAFKESKDYKSSEMMLRRAVSLAPHDLNIRRQLAAVVALNLVHNPRMGRN